MNYTRGELKHLGQTGISLTAVVRQGVSRKVDVSGQIENIIE